MGIFLKLACVFFKIGLLTIGGGLAMLPIIQHEMVSRGWLTNQQFLDIYGIAEMTPGPIAVNCATFVGYRTIDGQIPGIFWFAVLGAATATISVCLPSFFCVNVFGSFWEKHRDHPAMVRIFAILRPVVSGLVAAAAVSLCLNCLWQSDSFQTVIQRIPHLPTLLILLASFGLTLWTKFSPFLILLGGILLGIVVGG